MKQFTIRYIDERVRTLRENNPVKDRLLMGEKKVYKVSAIPSDVNYVSVRLVEISG